MPDTPFTPPPIPVHLAQFPTIGGLVVPFITLQHRNGRAALGVVDARRVELCLHERRCGVCAQVLTNRMVFLMRQSDLHRKCSVEPGLCPPCAAYTQVACPMISGYMARYRESVSPFMRRRCDDPACLCVAWSSPETSSARLGATAEQWYALWTQRYQLIHDDDGHLAASFAGQRVLAIREIRQQPTGGQ